MPDPAKSVGDIDDVLSSIRRLVAEQPGQNRADENRAPEPVKSNGGDERLVLTPALRVTDRDSRPQPLNGPDAALPQVEEAGGNDDTADQAQSIAEPDKTETGEFEKADAAPFDFAASLAAVTETALSEKTSVPDEEGERSSSATAAAEQEHETADSADETAAVAQDETEAAATESHSAETAHSEMQDDDAPAGPSLDAESVAEDAASAAPEMTEEERQEPALEPANDTLSSDFAEPEPEPDDAEPEAHSGVEEHEAAAEMVDAVSEPRVVGDDGWRPEMRLFDVAASAQSSDTGQIDPVGPVSEFESDTGDANWPDETAERAVFDLAAAREADTQDVLDDPEDDVISADATDENPTIGFTPIFSRRNSGPVDESDTPSSEPETDFSNDTSELSEAEAEGPDVEMAEDVGQVANDDAEIGAAEALETALENSEALVVEGFDTANTTAEDDAFATGEPIPFASIRDSRIDVPEVTPASQDEVPETTEASIPDDSIDADEQPANADVAASESTGAAARLTVLGGQNATDDADDVPDVLEESAGIEGSEGLDAQTHLIDEEVLRRIVAEAVREELQGALGERITRNVRKLVRREIRLLLAADELD